MLKLAKFVVVCSLIILTSRVSIAQDDSPHAPPVSLIRLIAQPGSNKPQKVQVAGYLVLVFEGEALYLHKEDYIKGLPSNAVRVSLSEEQMKKYKSLSGNYVWVEASFLKRPNSEELTSGTLFNVQEIRAINFKPRPAGNLDPEKTPLNK